MSNNRTYHYQETHCNISQIIISRINNPGSLSPSSQGLCSRSLTALLWTCSNPSMSFLNWGVKVWPHQCQVQGKNHCPGPAGRTIPDPGQEPLAFLAPWAHCWLMSTLLSTSAPRSLSAWPLSIHSVPSLEHCRGCCGQSAGPSIWSCETSPCWNWALDPASPGRTAEPPTLQEMHTSSWLGHTAVP